MTTIVLGQHPDTLEVRLVRGDSASLVATLTDSTGTAIPWPDDPTLEFASGRTQEAIVSHVATVDGETATWALSAAQVEAIAAASEAEMQDWLSTLARITLPDADDVTGSVEYAGKVAWSDGWTGGSRAQAVTFTVQGPPGPAGSSTTLIVVDGGTVDLPDEEDDGYLVGYDVTATTTFEGTEYSPGVYIFRRKRATYGGWRVLLIDEGDQVVPSPDAIAPTAGTLAGSAITETGFTLTVSGAADETALAVAPYAFSTDNGGSWSAYQSSAVYVASGLTASTGYSCKHRTKDAGGNVSTGTMVTVTTSTPLYFPGYDVIDTFTASNGTALTGRTTEVGGLVWNQNPTVLMGGIGDGGDIQSNAVRGGPTTTAEGKGLTVPVANYEVKIEYDISTGTVASTERRAYVGANAVSGSATDTVSFQVRADGSLLCFKGGIVAVTMTGTTSGWPNIDTLTLTVDHDNPSGSTLFSITDGTRTASCTIAHGTGYTGVGRVVAIGARQDAAAILAFGVKYL